MKDYDARVQSCIDKLDAMKKRLKMQQVINKLQKECDADKDFIKKLKKKLGID